MCRCCCCLSSFLSLLLPECKINLLKNSSSRMSDALITKSLGPELEEWKTCYISRIAKRPPEFQITQNWTEQDVTKIMN